MPKRFPCWAAAAALGGGCALPPPTEPVRFDVDDDELRRRQFRERVDEVADRLRADEDLRVVLIGHADEDNTRAYNQALSIRRAEAVREQMHARHPDLRGRVEVEGRGELEPLRTGQSAADKRFNRRVEFAFYYPRVCEPSWSREFTDCMFGRLEAAPETEPIEIDEQPTRDEVPPSRYFVGPFGYAKVGWGATSVDSVRMAGVWGLGAMWVFAPGGALRLSAGGFFDHFIDAGEPFVGSERPCAGCFRSVTALRVAPEFRIGAAGDRVWSAIRVFAGGALILQPAQVISGRPTLPAERDVGLNLGLGPSFSFRLWRHLTLGVDFGVSFDGRIDGGQGLFDATLSLGWSGGAWVAGG